MLDSLKHFGSSLLSTAKEHPVLAGLTILLVPLVLGGVVWKVIGLIRRVPGGSAVANGAEKLADATGSK